MALRFSQEKATQAAARLLQRAGGRLSHMKLIKLLYLAERRALLGWGRPIVCDWYVSMPHGPVLSFTLDLVNGDIDPDHPTYWHTYISERRDYEVELLSQPPNDRLSPAEEDTLDKVFEEFGGMSQWELRDLSHKFPEWQDPKGSSLPIEITDILRSEGLSEEDIQNIVDGLEAEAAAERILE